MIDCNILRDLIDQAISSEWKDIPVPPDVMTEVLDCLEQLSDMHETTLVWARKWRNERDALAALCREAAAVLERTANDTLDGRNMAAELRRQAEE